MRHLNLLALVLLTFFASCSSDDPTENQVPNNNGKEQSETKVYSHVGVWENGKYFVSFNNDGFCSSFFDDEFLDCGSYSVNDKTMICNNSYYNKQTKYTILSISDTSMQLKIEYNSLKGEALTKTMVFTKNKDKAPAIKDHSLIGKTFTRIVSLGGAANTAMWTFDTYNTGVRSMKSGGASKYPLKVFYLFMDNRMYFQTFETTSMGLVKDWAPSTIVEIWLIKFNTDGSISSMTKQG